MLFDWYAETHDFNWMIYRVDRVLKLKKIDEHITKEESELLANLLKKLQQFKEYET